MAGALTADVVVVELEARMQGYTAQVAAAARSFAEQMAMIGASAETAEQRVEASATAAGAAVGRKLPDAAGKADKALNSTKFATANLAAQFQDIGVMLAAGQSPFLLMLQQGTQVAGIMSMQEGGVGGAVKSVGAAVRSLISPVSLLSLGFVGLIAVAGQWAISALSGGEEVADVNERISSTLDRLKQAYGEARVAVNELSDAERTRLALLTEIDLAEATRKYRDALRSVFVGPEGNMRLNAIFPDPGESEYGQQLKAAIDAVIQSANEGTPDVTRFREELERIMLANADPQVDGIAQMLIDLVALDTETAVLEQSVQSLSDQLIVLTQAGTEEAEAARERLGLMTEGEAAFERHLELIDQAGAAYGGLGERSVAATELLLYQLQRSNEALRENFVAAAEEAVAAVTAIMIDGFTGSPEALAAVGEIRYAFSALQEDARDGETDIVAFREALASIANLQPENQALRTLVDAIIAVTDEAAAMQGPLAAGEAAIKGLAEAAGLSAKPVLDAQWAIVQLKDAMGGDVDKALIISIYEIGRAAAASKEEVIALDAALAAALGAGGEAASGETPKPTNGVYVKPTGSRGGGGGMSDAERAAQQIEETIADLRRQAEQLNRTAREQAVYNAFEQAGIDANHEMADAVRAAAEELFDQEEAVAAAAEALREWQDVMLSVRDQGWDAFESWVTGAKTAGEAIKDLIKQMLIAEARALILNALTPGTANDGPMGPISAIFKFVAGLVGRNAGGTDNWRGGLSWVGEQGPELLNLPRGAQIIPNHRLNDALGGFALHFAPVTHIDASGSGMNEARLRAILERNNERMRDELPSVLADHRSNRRRN